MSGGHFGHKQYEIQMIADSIEHLIDSNDDTGKDEFGWERGRHYSDEVIEKFVSAVETLRKAGKMVRRIDWLVSDDDGEDTFLRRWQEEIEAVRE